MPHLLRLLGRRPAGRAGEIVGAGQARAAEVGDIHRSSRLNPQAARLVAVGVCHLAPLAQLVLRAEALGHRADERRAPRAGYFGLDVVHVHDDDPADAAELEGAAAYVIPHVVTFEPGYGMLYIDEKHIDRETARDALSASMQIGPRCKGCAAIDAVAV